MSHSTPDPGGTSSIYDPLACEILEDKVAGSVIRGMLYL